MHLLREDVQAVHEWTAAAVALAREHGFIELEAAVTCYQGWIQVERGRPEAGIIQLNQGLTALRARGAEIGRPFYLALLAGAYSKAEQVEKGLMVLAEALALMDQTDERFYEAELYRMKGELSLQARQVTTIQGKPGVRTNPEAEAGECFRKAIAIACHQSVKSLELRAVMSLARLWQQHGKKNEARQMLSDIYGWFTEGFDTKDLKDARALLEDLS